MNITSIVEILKKNKFISELLSEKSFGQFKRYLVTGFVTFGMEYLIFFTLYKYIKLWYIAANTITYIIIFWFNFLMNKMWSFKSRDNLRRQLILYGILFVFNLVVINALMYLLSDIAGISPLISKVMVMCAVVSWNFVLYKKVIYK